MKLLTQCLRKKRFNEALRYLSKWQNPDPEEAARYQFMQLQTVWNDAVTHIPYYRELAQTDKAPRDFQSLEEFFEKVPVLERSEISCHPELFKRLNRKPDGKSMTAGSTGEPLHFGYFKEEKKFPAASLLVGRIANGMEIEDRLFLLWGHSHLLGTGIGGRMRHLLRSAKDCALNYYRADAYHLDSESSRRHMKVFLNFKPHILIGYASAIDIFVRYNQSLKKEVHKLGLKFVSATAEVLPRPDSRQIIENFFNCPLVMEYGGVEFGAVAHNQPASPYKVYWRDCLVETLEEKGTAAADARPIAVTTLYPRYLPLIRYRVGDEIRGDIQSANGSILQFAEVCGRHNDVVQLDNGHSIHSVALFHCIHQEPEVHNIQLVLEPHGSRLLLVSSSQKPEIIQRIRRRLDDLNGALRSCKIEFVSDLITNRAGKRRWILDRRKTHAE